MNLEIKKERKIYKSNRQESDTQVVQIWLCLFSHICYIALDLYFWELCVKCFGNNCKILGLNGLKAFWKS